MKSLGQQLQKNVDSFGRLSDSLEEDADGAVDSPINAIPAVRIGSALEELERQRQRAQDAKFLIQCWIEVNDRGDLSSLEDVRRLAGSDGKVRCANIARQLLKIHDKINSSASPVPGGRTSTTGRGSQLLSQNSNKKQHSTREIIEKFLESLENDLLTQFDEFYRRQNFEGMKV